MRPSITSGTMRVPSGSNDQSQRRFANSASASAYVLP
ncbi:hypothetical protein OERS_11410 [Oerskovia enterophila]|uniref:Uncharacterized protein n=1 Tax=Oerskovia enterophila TaxID=43678 RepID=A0ABX2Y910_9CELL|nr:hypothetical protein OERS_11410 [Oerskovia enterophila]